jgi:hypothetical protein
VLWAFPWGEEQALSIVPLPEPWASKYPWCKFGPDKWACEVLDEIGEQVRKNGFDGVHAVRPIRLAIASGHGIGKAECVDNFIDTPSGRKRFGDLKVGDHVFGPDGRPTQIVAIPYRGVRPCYRVKFDDRTYVDVAQEHLWSVQGRGERRKKSNGYRVLETQEILSAGLRSKRGVSAPRQWAIPRHGPVEYPWADLPVHPYLMGLLLGGGKFGEGDEVHLVVKSDDVLDRLIDVAPEEVWQVKRYSSCVKVTLRHKELIKAAGFTDGVDRSIPDDYKYSSVQQREELFRGLFDADAEVTNAGSVVYFPWFDKLADEVSWLVRSLGGKASKLCPDRKVDETEETISVRYCRRILIALPEGFRYGYDAKRTDRVKQVKLDRYRTRWIDSIEPLGEKETMCITVDRKDGLYLTSDFIVTHNSCITAFLAIWIMATRPHSKGVVTANTASQLETKTFAEISKWLKRSLIADMFTVKAMSIEANESPETWRLDAQTCREENSESFAGLHSASSTPYYIFDEASAVPDIIWEVAEGGLTDGEPMFFAFGNPTRNTGRFRECFTKRRHIWNTRQIDSRDVFITNKDQLTEWAQEYGEDSDFFRVRVKGEFPMAASTQFIPIDIVERASKLEVINNQATCAIIGVDVARYGDDSSSIYTRIGRGWLPRKKYSKLSLTRLADLVIEHYYHVQEATGFSRDRVYIAVDEGGVGAGLVDILRDRGFRVFAVQFGGAADNPTTYKMKRDELWGRARDFLNANGSIPNDPELIEDLTSPDYEVLPTGQIKLESKKDMKKRGLRSPDAADSFCLTFAVRVEEYAPERELRRYSGKPDVRNFDPFKCLGGV